MAKKSAGLLLFRERAGRLEVLLVHPGGPYWTKKDEGAWSIPKGELGDDEDALAAARREETGADPPDGDPFPLDPVRQPSGKVVHAWAIRGDFDPARLKSNSFTMEWPPRSARQAEFSEVDRAEWFRLDDAIRKIQKGQAPLLQQVSKMFARREPLT